MGHRCREHLQQFSALWVVAAENSAHLTFAVRGESWSPRDCTGLLFVSILCDCLSRRRLEAEILILRHQLNVLRQRANAVDCIWWAGFCSFGFIAAFSHPDAITIVRPETVVRWHRMDRAYGDGSRVRSVADRGR